MVSILKILVTLALSYNITANADPKDNLAPLGSSKAKKGGTFNIAITSEPESLHPLSSTDRYSSDIHEYTCDGLMTLNRDTYGWVPGLAEKYTVGKDGSYTFKLRKDAKFHDGTPLTAEDVKFSFDAVKDPKYKASHKTPYYENIGKIEVIDKHTVKFNIAKKYFNNFNVIVSKGYSAIISKAAYGDPKKKMTKKIVCSGPYKLGKYNKSKNIELVKNKDWWGWKDPFQKNRHNFDKIRFRFVKDENLRLQMMEKGKLDYLDLGKEAFYKKTLKAPWGKAIKKVAIKNDEPKGYGYIGWNLADEKFKDVGVRRAMTHLMNRELINEKFRYGKSVLATGPWHKFSMYADETVRPLAFDPEKAKALLDKAGWKDSDKDGVRDKVINGKKMDFSFTLMTASRDTEKYFTLYKEDLKKAGVRMNIKVVEWNTFLKSLDAKKFDGVAMGWSGGSVHLDPKQIWHSESARKGGSNFIGYKNKEVDKLIDQGRAILNHQKRAQLFKKVYRLIAEDAPYLFMFNDPQEQYAMSENMAQEKETYKFHVGESYWWTKK